MNKDMNEIRKRSNDETFQGQLPYLELLPKEIINIVDFGCGAGLHSLYFKNHGKKVIAIDCNLDAFLYKDIIPSYQKMEDLPSDVLPVQSIFASNVLEHTPNPGELVQYWRKYIQHEGYLIIVVPKYNPVVVNEHYTNGWNCVQLALFLVSQGFDCSESFFTETPGMGGQIFGFGRKRNFPATNFNLPLSLPFLPKSLHSLICKFPNGGEYFPTDISYFDKDNCNIININSNSKTSNIYCKNFKKIDEYIYGISDENNYNHHEICMKLSRDLYDIKGHGSQTSLQYQHDIRNIVLAMDAFPGPIIELGIHYGGLSIQLAYLANLLHKKLYCIDISKECIDISLDTMNKLELFNNNITFIHGTIHNFFDEFMLNIPYPPCLIIIDAGHLYSDVRDDICTILYHTPTVPYLCFHDFSLSINYSYYKLHQNDILPPKWVPEVDRAIADIFGQNMPLAPIGIIGNGPSENTHYFEKGRPEGCVLASRFINRQSLQIAYSYVAATNRNNIKYNIQPTNSSNSSITKSIEYQLHRLVRHIKKRKF